MCRRIRRFSQPCIRSARRRSPRRSSTWKAAASRYRYALARLRFPGSNFLGVGIFLVYLVPPSLLFLPLAQVIATEGVPVKPAGAGSPPVLMIPGIYCNAAVWWWMRRRLSRSGLHTVVINLEPPLASIDDFAEQLAEQLGVEGRAAYYDRTGALRDMVQNHLTQVLSLIAMEVPARLETEQIRDEKAKVLHSIAPIQLRDVVFGQYASYRSEPGVANDSFRAFTRESTSRTVR